MKRLVLLLLAASLSGCISVTTDVPSFGYPVEELEERFQSGREADFGLEDFAGDSLLVQVVPAGEVTVQFQAQLAMQESAEVAGTVVEEGSPRPCMSYFSPFYRHVSFSGVRHPVVELSGPGPQLDVRVPSFDVSYEPTFEHVFEPVMENHPVALGLALGDVAGWKEHGEIRLQLQSEQPFYWRVMDGGSMDCHPLAVRHEVGVGVDAGLATVIVDKEHRFTGDGQTMTTLYVGATGDYRVTLEGPDAFFEEYAGNAGFSYGTGFFQGAHRLWIDRLVSVQDPYAAVAFPSGVFVMHHHLPAWVLMPPWELPPLDVA